MYFLLILSLLVICWSALIPFIAHFLIHNQWRNIISNRYLFAFYITSTSLLWIYTVFYLQRNFPINFIFLSALHVTILTDCYFMLISRFATLYLIPIGYAAAWCKLLPISLTESITGGLFGYMILWMCNTMFKKIKGHDGLGQGDSELLAMIGTFTGPIGCWMSLLYGSWLGLIAAAFYFAVTKKQLRILPFGSFLAIGSMVYFL